MSSRINLTKTKTSAQIFQCESDSYIYTIHRLSSLCQITSTNQYSWLLLRHPFIIGITAIMTICHDISIVFYLFLPDSMAKLLWTYELHQGCNLLLGSCGDIRFRPPPQARLKDLLKQRICIYYCASGYFKNISITLVPISCDQSCPGVRNRISWTVLYKIQMACQAINKQGLMAECKMFHQIPVVSMSVYATGYRPMTPVKSSKHASFLAVFDGPVPLKARVLPRLLHAILIASAHGIRSARASLAQHSPGPKHLQQTCRTPACSNCKRGTNKLGTAVASDVMWLVALLLKSKKVPGSEAIKNSLSTSVIIFSFGGSIRVYQSLSALRCELAPESSSTQS